MLLFETPEKIQNGPFMVICCYFKKPVFIAFAKTSAEVQTSQHTTTLVKIIGLLKNACTILPQRTRFKASLSRSVLAKRNTMRNYYAYSFLHHTQSR